MVDYSPTEVVAICNRVRSMWEDRVAERRNVEVDRCVRRNVRRKDASGVVGEVGPYFLEVSLGLRRRWHSTK